MGLKCWHCDDVQYEHCGDPFSGNSSNNQWYIDCLPGRTKPGNIAEPPACLKSKTRKFFFSSKFYFILKPRILLVFSFYYKFSPVTHNCGFNFRYSFLLLFLIDIIERTHCQIKDIEIHTFSLCGSNVAIERALTRSLQPLRIR